MIGAAEVKALDHCLRAGGVALFPADTVYGLGCDPDSREAIERLYELKGRPARKPAAVMFSRLEHALAQLPELGPRTRRALEALLPGPVTLLVPNRGGRFAWACGPDPATLGLRVPAWPPELSALGTLARPLLQSSANRAGEPDARAVGEVPVELRAGVDLVLDGGELPGLASSVIDLRAYERAGDWQIVREGAFAREAVDAALA
jgi:L-threonylcarbamoyladenylate synthase